MWEIISWRQQRVDAFSAGFGQPEDAMVAMAMKNSNEICSLLLLYWIWVVYATLRLVKICWSWTFNRCTSESSPEVSVLYMWRPGVHTSAGLSEVPHPLKVQSLQLGRVTEWCDTLTLIYWKNHCRHFKRWQHEIMFTDTEIMGLYVHIFSLKKMSRLMVNPVMFCCQVWKSLVVVDNVSFCIHQALRQQTTPNTYLIKSSQINFQVPSKWQPRAYRYSR